MTRQNILVSLDPRIINLLKDRGVTNRSAFIAQAVESHLLTDKKMVAFMMASKIKEHFESGSKLLKEFEKEFKTKDYQGILDEWGVAARSDEQKALQNLHVAILKAYDHDDLVDPKKKQFILNWLETRAPGFGLNYPASIVFDKLMDNGFGEAKA